MNKNLFIAIIIGVIFYTMGFLKGGLYSTFLMSAGGLICFVPLLIIGVNLKPQNRNIANVLVLVSSIFIISILLYMIMGIAYLIK